MSKVKKDYLIYFIMLVLFSGLIYVALEEGGRFDHFSVVHIPQGGSSDSFQMFKNILIEKVNSPFTILLLQIIVILFTVRLFSYLFKYIGQPGVIGEIVAGIVLGPSLFGYLFPDFFGFLFRPDSLGNLQIVSQIGLILFMFVIGMELDFSTLKNKINETLVISHAGILVPFFLGVISSYWIYEEYAAQQTAFLPFALFIGISMSITAFPVLARIIQEKNLTKTPIGILSIASAANDDVTAWCLLAVVIAISKAGTLGSALYAVALTFVYIAVMFLVIRPFLRKVGNVYANKEVINKTFVGFIFIILIVSSTLTEVLGIHALFGAFIAGVVMPSNFGFRKVLMEKVEDVSLVFFLPLFFAFTGLHTQIGLINSPSLFGVLGLLVAVAIAGKLGGCTIAARLVGESWKNSLIVGTLMNTRGLMQLVALNIGYEMGILPPSIFVILIIMALVTTFMTTPLLTLVEKIFEITKPPISLTKKLILCFGRIESGRDLLSVYELLFGPRLKQKELIAAHYTLGTDVNPIQAKQYEEESFDLLNTEAQRASIKVDCRYKVTDKLIQDITHLVQTENPDLLLLGAGSNYMLEGGTQVLPLLGLFRNKVDDIIGQVNCDVAVFVNRGYQHGDIAIVLGGAIDSFMLFYLESLLMNGIKDIQLYLFVGDDKFTKKVNDLLENYPEQVVLHPIHDLSEISYRSVDGLLILSHTVCEKIAENKEEYEALPSLLVMSPKSNTK
ncbi:transporter, CPA2 family [Bacteroides luti]|jgi:Kef-type K+ transport system membrane component KefB|uniref:Transporter, CPA2 family n=1 Tax=Bacteroides luti TaxID=1297750 RepID=A0A1M5FCP2_9BACE|nr:cation:proton antiporter [Bacteroides luti]SHF89343.1 transporter, CPA2 family [Bacteroides luti]